MKLTAEKILSLLDEKSLKHFGSYFQETTQRQAFKSLCLVVRDILAMEEKAFSDECQRQEAKQVYYMSMEFLVGTSLRNNLYNLGLQETFAQALCQAGFDIEKFYAMEPDAGLGNGGLGRLASCYMDSLTSLRVPATGFSIRYEFGIFRQKIVDGWQMEFPDNWLDLGDVWLRPRSDEAFEVKFGGQVAETVENGRFKAVQYGYNTVIAVPYDMLISGYHSGAANKLVLWSAKSPNSLDMTAFSRGEYARALEQNTMAEVISKVLYPADDHIDGKILRLKQQYLLVSASLQSIISNHLKRYGSLSSLPDKVAIHINDTHPALCVPELMRLLVDEYGFDWDPAWDIACRTLAYTNHTVMSEALERWPEDLFREQLPRIYQLVCEINRRLVARLSVRFPGDLAKIDYMAIIAHGEIRMANLCLACCHTVNGVSQLHSDILTKSIFRDYYTLNPRQFTNVTNGIAYRRWLCQSNPLLTQLLLDTIGDRFLTDAMALEEFAKYQGDRSVLERLGVIKRQNKVRLAEYIASVGDVPVDPDSIFDVQIKRLHEYKRQLLNALHILYLYRRIKEDPSFDMPPRTFLFAAKASSGYYMAKQIIRLISRLAQVIDADPAVRGRIKVVFLEDYKVSLAEIIIPAAEISEQISIAGKEASGTGNMKLMINGAVTLGTMDGANVEIFQQVGAENMFLFGMTAEEVEAQWRRGYDPVRYYRTDPDIKGIVDTLASEDLGTRFDDIVRSLLTGAYGHPDAYMTLADFRSYAEAQERSGRVYRDREAFLNMSLINIAKAGVFSSDRAVLEYADRIWKVQRVL